MTVGTFEPSTVTPGYGAKLLQVDCICGGELKLFPIPTIPETIFREGYLHRVKIGGLVHAIDVVIGTYETTERARAAFGLFWLTMIETLEEGRHALSVINDKVVSALDGKLSL